MSKNDQDGKNFTPVPEKVPGNIKKRPEKPTAVAIRRDPLLQELPKIIAAGRGALAERILEIAFQNGIKVREDSDLAELLAKIEIDSEIPSEAIMAVAEIMSYVYKANGAANPFDVILDPQDEVVDSTIASTYQPDHNGDPNDIIDNDD